MQAKKKRTAGSKVDNSQSEVHVRERYFVDVRDQAQNVFVLTSNGIIGYQAYRLDKAIGRLS